MKSIGPLCEKWEPIRSACIFSFVYFWDFLYKMKTHGPGLNQSQKSWNFFWCCFRYRYSPGQIMEVKPRLFWKFVTPYSIPHFDSVSVAMVSQSQTYFVTSRSLLHTHACLHESFSWVAGCKSASLVLSLCGDAYGPTLMLIQKLKWSLVELNCDKSTYRSAGWHTLRVRRGT